jgi:hypothetical protein
MSKTLSKDIGILPCVPVRTRYTRPMGTELGVGCHVRAVNGTVGKAGTSRKGRTASSALSLTDSRRRVQVLEALTFDLEERLYPVYETDAAGNVLVVGYGIRQNDDSEEYGS